MTRPLFSGGRTVPPGTGVATPVAAPPAAAVVPEPVAPARVRTFHAEQAQVPAARPLFAPSMTAELPSGFAAALATQGGSGLPDAAQRSIYRLVRELGEARDEDILQFGEQPASAVDDLLKQATSIMTDPDLAQVGTLLAQTLSDLVRHGPQQGRRGWLQRFTRPSATWFQDQAELLEARLAELERLEQDVLDDASRLVELMEHNDDQLEALAEHRWACLMAHAAASEHDSARRERLGRRAQLLGTLYTSAQMTSRQLHMAREHLLNVAERVQTLRFATLPLWRQQFLAPRRGTEALAEADQQGLQTHRQLVEQLEHLVQLTTRKTYE